MAVRRTIEAQFMGRYAPRNSRSIALTGSQSQLRQSEPLGDVSISRQPDYPNGS